MEPMNYLKEISVRDFVNSIFRCKFFIIYTVIAMLILAYLGLQLQTPVYQATVKMYIKGQSHTASSVYSSLGPFRIHYTQMEILRSNPVILRTVNALKLDEQPLDYEKKYATKLKKMLIDYRVEKTHEDLAELTPAEKKEKLIENAVKDLKGRITTELIPNTDIFMFSVKDYDAKRAIELANVISRAYTIYDQQQQLAELTLKYGDMHPSVKQLSDNIYIMNKKLSGKQLPDLEAIGTASVKILEQATSNYYPIGKSKKFMMILAFLVSIFLGIGFALAFDFLDNSIKSAEDIVKYLKIPLLGSVPKKKRSDKLLIKDSKKKSLYSNSFVSLSDEMYTFLKTQNLKTILLTSPMAQNKKSAIALNIGYSLSKEWDLNTLVIDANVNSSYFEKMLNINNESNVANIVENSANQTYDEIAKKLNVLTAGKTEQKTINLLSSSKMEDIINSAKEKFEAVIIDCTMLENLKDTMILSTFVDGVVVVVNQGRERRQVVQSLILPYRNKKINCMGAIFNNRTFDVPKFIYNRL